MAKRFKDEKTYVYVPPDSGGKVTCTTLNVEIKTLDELTEEEKKKRGS